MLKDLSKWKMCSLMVAFIFFFNTVVLSGVVIAANTPKKDVIEIINKREKVTEKKLKDRHKYPSDIVEDTATSEYTETAIVTPEIEELAAELNYNAGEIFSYVRNTIDYQPYYGSVKGSVGTYWEKAGNDCDQSSFLIALFRASDIPARYVSGEVTVPIDMAMNWVGTENPETAVEIFSRNSIPLEVVYLQDSNEITGIKMYRVWVEAFFYSPKKQKKVKGLNYSNHSLGKSSSLYSNSKLLALQYSLANK